MHHLDGIKLDLNFFSDLYNIILNYIHTFELFHLQKFLDYQMMLYNHLI
jgi:hypothetical protein